MEGILVGLLSAVIGWAVCNIIMDIFGYRAGCIIVAVMATVCFLVAGVGVANAAESAGTVTTLEQSFVSIIQQVTSGVQQGVDFLKSEIPDVVRQLITFNLVYKGLSVAFGFLIVLSIPVYWWAANRKDLLGKESIFMCGVFYTLLGGFAGLMIFFTNIGEFLKLYLAPKVWLIEYAAQLIK